MKIDSKKIRVNAEAIARRKSFGSQRIRGMLIMDEGGKVYLVLYNFVLRSCVNIKDINVLFLGLRPVPINR
jgi:hypothetical protein